jgi:F-type H+-transporting ATPase subunit delta
MSGNSIARRYAKGLIRNIDPQADGPKILAALEHASSLYEMEETRKILRNPAVSAEIKRDVLTFATDKVGTHPSLKIFLEQLASARRVELFPVIVDEFRKQLNQLTGIENAIVTSAVELSDAEKKQLQSELESLFNKKIILENHVNQDLIGGVYISVGNFIVDLSVKSKIQNLLHTVSQS